MTSLEDDDEESCGSIGTNRYQATPSLQAVQQMKNRLHIAFLGKKLMKWTAMATGKELRKISEELNLNQEECYTERFVEAMLLIARAHYHNDNFHKVLLENVGSEAEVTVKSSPRYIAGAKIMILEMVEEGPPAQPYVAIGRGGEVVHQARDYWRHLLTNLLNILHLRESFNSLNKAFTEATKKKNVLSKIIIPKTINTIRYIMNELEELDREDFFRLKKIKNLKLKKQPQSKSATYSHGRPICAHVCMEVITEETSAICHSCQLPIMLRVGVECGLDKVFVCDTCRARPDMSLAEIIQNIEVIGKNIDKVTNEVDRKAELAKYLHNVAWMKEYILEEVCPRESCSTRALVPYIPKQNQRGTNEDALKPNIMIKPSHGGKIKIETSPKYAGYAEDELIEGVFVTEYKEITKIIRTRGPDGKLREKTTIIKSINHKVNPEEEEVVESNDLQAGPSEQKKDMKITKSVVTVKSATSRPKVRPCISWHSTSSKKSLIPGSQDRMEMIKNIQLSSARMGVILLPADISSKIARIPKTKTSKSTKKENKKSSRH